MKIKKLKTLSILTALLLAVTGLIPAVQAGELYKCTTADGRVQYSQQPPTTACAEMKTMKVDTSKPAADNASDKTQGNKAGEQKKPTMQIQFGDSGNSLELEAPPMPNR